MTFKAAIEVLRFVAFIWNVLFFGIVTPAVLQFRRHRWYAKRGRTRDFITAAMFIVSVVALDRLFWIVFLGLQLIPSNWDGDGLDVARIIGIVGAFIVVTVIQTGIFLTAIQRFNRATELKLEKPNNGNGTSGPDSSGIGSPGNFDG